MTDAGKKGRRVYRVLYEGVHSSIEVVAVEHDEFAGTGMTFAEAKRELCRYLRRCRDEWAEAARAASQLEPAHVSNSLLRAESVAKRVKNRMVGPWEYHRCAAHGVGNQFRWTWPANGTVRDAVVEYARSGCTECKAAWQKHSADRDVARMLLELGSG